MNMRVSLWQQFSSNHSSHFTVVGRFASEAEAERVAEQLHTWMTEIIAHWESYWKQTLDRRDFGETEIETYIRETYGLQWYENGMDWNGWPDNVSDIVSRVHSHVFFNCEPETWNSPVPIAGLMWKLGAMRVDYGILESEDRPLSAYLTCEAPDEATSMTFYEHTAEYLGVERSRSLEFRQPLWSQDLHRHSWSSIRGVVLRKEKQIQMYFQSWDMGVAISQLVKYFEEHGYTDITYHFSQAQEWPEHYIESLRKSMEFNNNL